MSDCGTDFVGANQELKNLLKSFFSIDSKNSVANFTSSEGIKQRFNPPGASHFEGLCVSGGSSMKYNLRQTMGNSLLTLEEFYTLTTQIEGCLNLRPLCPLSPDPNDLIPLIPALFLVGSALTAIPELDLFHLICFK